MIVRDTYDSSLALSRRFIPQSFNANNSPFRPPNTIFHSPPDKLL